MDKEQAAIARLQTASEMSLKLYKEPLVITTSGGKDSAVCIAIAERAGIPIEVMHNHTTVDAPETVRFVREDFRRLEEKGVKCTTNFPVYKGQRVTMWSLIPQKLMPPTRVVRYCCAILKERGGAGRFITTGVRWAESVKRKGRGVYETMHKDPEKRIILNNDNDERRRLFENCALKAKRTCNPIIDWTDTDVWDYIEAERLPINPLYQCGYADRIYIANDCIFPEDWTLDDLMRKHRSRPYNPLIANTFFRAGFIEAWGRGIEKIKDSCMKAGNPMPEYTIKHEDIMVMFKSLVSNTNQAADQAADQANPMSE